MPSTLYTQLKQTATEFAHAAEQVHTTGDITKLSTTLTTNCRRNFHPKSITEIMPILAGGRSNEEYEQQEAPSFEHFAASRVEITDLVVDEELRKAVVGSITHCTTKQGDTYSFDFMYVLYMTEDGAKVYQIEEYVDTAEAMKFVQGTGRSTDH